MAAAEEGEVLVASCEARSGTRTEAGVAAAEEEKEEAPEGFDRSPLVLLFVVPEDITICILCSLNKQTSIITHVVDANEQCVLR